MMQTYRLLRSSAPVWVLRRVTHGCKVLVARASGRHRLAL